MSLLPWTVLLLRPEYAAGTFGRDIVCLHVNGSTAADALESARANVCETDEWVFPEDYYCLFCASGHFRNLADGNGGVSEPAGSLLACEVCDGPFVREWDGVSYHQNEDGGVDHDKDGDHVAYGESPYEQPGKQE